MRLLIDEDERVMRWVGKIKLHPLSSWMVVVSEHLCLCCDMDCKTLEKGRRGANFFFAIFDIRTYHVHEYGDECEVGDLVEDVISSGEEGRVWVVLSVEVNAAYEVICPSPHSVVQDGVCLSVPLYGFAQFDDRAYLWLRGVTIEPQLVAKL